MNNKKSQLHAADQPQHREEQPQTEHEQSKYIGKAIKVKQPALSSWTRWLQS